MRLSSFRLAACLSICSSAFMSFAASVARVVDAVALFVLAAFDPRPSRFELVGATPTVRVLGLPQTRSFARRRIDRPDSRSRAPDSMAFVTA